MFSLHHSALLPSPSYKTSQRTLYSTCTSPKSLTRLWNFRNADQWRPERRSKQWLCGGKHAASQKSERPPLSPSQAPPFIRPLSILSPQAVCSGGTKKDMGVKSAIELYNPLVLFQLFPSDNFQAIEPPSPINWGLCTHLSFSLCLIHQKVLSN